MARKKRKKQAQQKTDEAAGGMTDPRSVLPLAAKDLACFALLVYPGFELAKHLRLLIEKLEAVARGEIKRLMIFMPPRSGKSVLTTLLFVLWCLGLHPDWSVIVASYGQDLADDFGRRVRNFLSDPIYQAIFPHVKMTADGAAQNRLNLVDGGSAFFVGRGSAITGRGGNLLLIDDPIKDADEARSESVRRSLHEWFGSVAFTRLTPDGAVVIIQTRWHQDDLAGWLLHEHADQGWDVLSLPAIAEQDESFRKAGEALWPERFPLPVLQSIRAQVGGAAWASLYQQRPAAAEGAVFKREWWKFYDRQPDQFKRRILSVDSAFKVGAQNDYTVIQLWGETQTGFYLLLNLRERFEFPVLKQKLVSIYAQLHPDVVLVEDCASGQSLLQELRASTSLPLKPIRPDRDKVSRATAASALVESGRVYLPSPQITGWVADFLDELSAFPNATHDDQVDALSQALNYFREQPGGWACVMAHEFAVAQAANRLLPAGRKVESDASSLALAQKTGVDAFDTRKHPVAVIPYATAACPNCGNDSLTRWGDGLWKCGPCGTSGRDKKPRTERCPSCGSRFITRLEEGRWRCHCGRAGQDEVEVEAPPSDKSREVGISLTRQLS